MNEISRIANLQKAINSTIELNSGTLYTYLVVINDSFCKGLIQHFAVPFLKSLGLGNLLIWRMTVEDVVVPFTWWAGPNMASHIPVGENQIHQ